MDALISAHPELNESIKETEYFTFYNPQIEEIGTEARQFAQAAFAMPEGILSKPIVGSDTFYMLEVTEKKEVDEVKFEEEKEQLHGFILQDRKYKLLNAFTQELKSKYSREIKLNNELINEIAGSV